MAHPTYSELLPILQAASKRWVPELIIDQENEPAVRSVLAWSCAHPAYDGDPGKGLLLIGHKGSGKTLLMRSLGLCLPEDLRFQVHNTRKVTSAYNTEGDAAIRAYAAPKNIMFDDLGDERRGNFYQDKVEVMRLVIEDRYELFVDRGITTHFTTNLTTAEIRERYGDRVYSRLKHMVNIIQVGAEVEALDRRNNAPAPVRQVKQVIERIPASPEVAAEAMRRVREVIGSAKRAWDAKPQPLSVVRHTVEDVQAQTMERFVNTLRMASLEELQLVREEIEAGTMERKVELIAAVDAEVECRESDTVHQPEAQVS